MTAETPMGREWRLRLTADQERRRLFIRDSLVPGLRWSPASHAKHGADKAEQGGAR